MKFKQMWQNSLLWFFISWCLAMIIFNVGILIFSIGFVVWLAIVYFTAPGVFWNYLSYLPVKQKIMKEFLKKSVNLHPLIPQPYLSLGNIFAREKNWPEAIRVLEEAAGLYNNRLSKDIKTMWAISCREVGEYQKALTLLNDLYQQGNKSYIIVISLAITHLKLNNLNEALEWANKARGLDFKATQPVLITGRVFYEQKEYQRAVDDYHWLIKHMSWPVESYYWLGRAEWELGEKEAALKDLKTAVERIKDDPDMSDVTLTEAETWLKKVEGWQ